MTAPTGLDTGLRVGFRPFRYDPKIFSPRVRAILPAKYLARAGVQATIVPEDGSGHYDCVVLQKAYSERDLELAAKWSSDGTKIIFDLCDNHFYNPEHDPAVAARVGRLERMIEMADAVTVSAREIAKLIPAKPIHRIDDALERLPFATLAERVGRELWRRRRRRHLPIRLVWHGQSGSEHLNSGLMPLTRIVPELAELHQRIPITLTVIGNKREPFTRFIASSPFPTHFIQWRSRTFALHFARHDICVLPIEHNEFTVCKTNNRATASFLLGVPVIVDDIPSYHELEPWIRFGNWAANIEEYAGDPELARTNASEARRHIIATYTEEHVVAQWSKAVDAVMNSRSP